GNTGNGITITGTLTNLAGTNVVANNFVGVDVSGKAVLGNSAFGIEVSGANNNSIGANVGGGNADGIDLDNGAQNNIAQRHFVGVAADGATPVSNKLHGIALHSDGNLAAPNGPGQANEPGTLNNLIGGTGAGNGNTVAFNGTGGIAVFGNPVSLSGQGNTGN